MNLYVCQVDFKARASHTTFDPGGSAGYHKDGSAPRKDANDGINADTAAPKIGESNILSTNLGASKRSGPTPAEGKGPNATASNGKTRTPPRAVSFKEINTPKAVRTVTHGVDTDNSPSSVSEAMAKDQQVVEAVLRDKDPERSQAQGTGKHSNRKRTSQRAKQGSEATGTTQTMASSCVSRCSNTNSQAPHLRLCHKPRSDCDRTGSHADGGTTTSSSSSSSSSSSPQPSDSSRRSRRHQAKARKTHLHKSRPEHIKLRGGRSDSEPDSAYMRGWDEDERIGRDAQSEAHDLETAESMRPEGEESQEELSLAHVTDTVQRHERRKRKEWTIQTDTPIAESGANGHTCVQVTCAGNPKGLKLSRNFALVQSTSKPLSRANIGPGHTIEKIGTVEVQQLRAEERTNKHLL